LAVVVKTRPPLAAKVVGAVIGFNPFAGASPPVTVQDRLIMVSIEKTVRIMLLNVMRYGPRAKIIRNILIDLARSNPQGPFTGRISQHIARLSQAKAELNDTFSRKRTASAQDTDAFKRQKMDRIAAMQEAIAPVATLPPPQAQPPVSPMQQMLPGPVTYAKLFTLATDPALTSFDGQQLPLDLVLQIVVGSLYRVDQNKLDAAIAVCIRRFLLPLSG
jgi:symplekin